MALLVSLSLTFVARNKAMGSTMKFFFLIVRESSSYKCILSFHSITSYLVSFDRERHVLLHVVSREKREIYIEVSSVLSNAF